MALPTAQVACLLGREPRKADLDPKAPDEDEALRPPFQRVALAGGSPIPVDKTRGLLGSLGFAGGKRYVLSGGRKEDAGDRAILLQSSGNLESLKKADLKLESPIQEVLGPGCFGENVFVESSEFVPEKLCVGDELECWRGEVKMPLRLQISSPRLPCGKVDQKMGKTYTISGVRPFCARKGFGGFFLRVLQEGDVQTGDVLKVVVRPWPQWTLSRVCHLLYGHERTVMQYLMRARKAVRDLQTEVVLRNEFMGSQEELEQLAALKELAVFEWREHAVKLLGQPPIGRYKNPLNLGTWKIVGAMSVLLLAMWMMRSKNSASA